MFETGSDLSVTTVAEVVRIAVAPVFLLSGIGAFLNVCSNRLSRIVDRTRLLEPLLLQSRGADHDRWLREINVLDRRMSLVSWTISLSVLSAVLICFVVCLLFAASLSRVHVATVIALLFIVSMIALACGFTVFLVETRLSSRSIRVRDELLQHEVDDSR